MPRGVRGVDACDQGSAGMNPLLFALIHSSSHESTPLGHAIKEALAA
jgi:hypothetical protein